jgi:hypothetical protein
VSAAPPPSSPAPAPTFEPGQTLTHSAKPEWGTGTVVKAEGITQNGKKAQRLTIRFARGGLKTLSTAFASLRPAGDAAIRDAINPLRETGEDRPKPAATPRTRVPGGGRDASEAPPPNPFEKLDPAKAREVMVRLPEEARDPFSTLSDRLAVTMGLYRHTPDGGRLIEWAAAQSGLADPLVAFNRHELEVFFDRYRINRDAHLLDLLRAAKRERVDVNAVLKPVVDRLPGDARRSATETVRRLAARR